MNAIFSPKFLERRIKMMQNPLPNNRNPKSERETNAAVVKTLFPSINVEDELCYSSISHSYYYME